MRLRVAVVEDDQEFMNAFISVLTSEFEIVGTFSDGNSALAALAAIKLDVAVLALQLPDTDGIELTRRIKQNGNHFAIVICSVVRDQDITEAAFNSGASGYVWKDRIASELVLAVKCAAKGKRFCSKL